MATLNAHLADAPATDGRPTVELSIDNLPKASAAPTVDTLSGATDTGKAVMKAKDAAAARTAIGAGTPYTLPAAGTAIGGVKKGAAVAPAATGADAAARVTTVNALIASLKAAGVIA